MGRGHLQECKIPQHHAPQNCFISTTPFKSARHEPVPHLLHVPCPALTPSLSPAHGHDPLSTKTVNHVLFFREPDMPIFSSNRFGNSLFPKCGRFPFPHTQIRKFTFCRSRVCPISVKTDLQIHLFLHPGMVNSSHEQQIHFF